MIGEPVRDFEAEVIANGLKAPLRRERINTATGARSVPI